MFDRSSSVRSLLIASVCLMNLAVVGCGGSQYAASEAPVSRAPSPETVVSSTASDALFAMAAEVPPADAADDATEPAKVQPKIIYSATVDLVVEDFTQAVGDVNALVQQFDGFVASSSIEGNTGAQRYGHWTLRIPAVRYDAFLAASKGLGELQRVEETSQEVTAEFYDVEARIRNKQKEEVRLLEHLEGSTAKLEDILAVEKELSRVREEIERMQGRMRVLKDQTTFSTITLTMREVRDYLPAEVPTLSTRIRRAWTASIDTLTFAGQGLMVTLVFLAPWLVLLGVAVWVLVYVIRVVLRRRKVKVKHG